MNRAAVDDRIKAKKAAESANLLKEVLAALKQNVVLFKPERLKVAQNAMGFLTNSREKTLRETFKRWADCANGPLSRKFVRTRNRLRKSKAMREAQVEAELHGTDLGFTKLANRAKVIMEEQAVEHFKRMMFRFTIMDAFESWVFVYSLNVDTGVVKGLKHYSEFWLCRYFGAFREYMSDPDR